MGITRIDLPDPGSQDPEVGLFHRMQQELRQRLISAAAELTPSQLAWVPEKDGNSIGMLLLHIVEAELFWIQYVCIGQELTEEQKEQYRTELFGNPDAPPLVEHPTAWFVERLDESRAITEEFHTTLSDAKLEECKHFVDNEDREYEFTIRWILFHLLEHEAGHRAQILVLRRMIQVRDIP